MQGSKLGSGRCWMHSPGGCHAIWSPLCGWAAHGLLHQALPGEVKRGFWGAPFAGVKVAKVGERGWSRVAALGILLFSLAGELAVPQPPKPAATQLLGDPQAEICPSHAVASFKECTIKKQVCNLIICREEINCYLYLAWVCLL